MTPCRRSTALAASLSLGGVHDLGLMFFERIEDFRLARDIRVLGCALVAVEMTRRALTRLAAAVGAACANGRGCAHCRTGRGAHLGRKVKPPACAPHRDCRRTLACTALFALALLPLAAVAQQAAPSAAPSLRIATGEAPPFVLQRDNGPTGFSIDLWNAIAEKLRVTTRYVDLGRRSDDAQIEALRTGAADVAISALVMTPAREQRIDFTIPYYDAGLQIAVRPDGGGGLPGFGLLGSMPWGAILNLVLGGTIILVVLAHVLWLVERRRNPRFQRGYLHGVAEGLWGVVLIIATGEHGDRDESPLGKRLTIALMWLFGVVLIAQFTASVTSSLTVQQLQSSIRGPDDLPGKAILTAPGSVAEAWLRDRGLAYRTIGSAEEAMRLLRSGEAQAVVYEAPTLRYWSRIYGADELAVVGPVFRPEKYALAVASDSPLRRQINAALLELYADGRYDEISRRWFSDGQ